MCLETSPQFPVTLLVSWLHFAAAIMTAASVLRPTASDSCFMLVLCKYAKPTGYAQLFVLIQCPSRCSEACPELDVELTQ